MYLVFPFPRGDFSRGGLYLQRFYPQLLIMEIFISASLTHSGKYMVRATNSSGEAQSIADFAVFEPTPDTMVEVVKTLVFEDMQKVEKMVSF